jgi:hypothetical protein
MESASSIRSATPTRATFQASYGTPTMSPAAAQIAREWNEAAAIPTKLSLMEDADEDDEGDNIVVKSDEITTASVRQDDNEDEAPATPKMFNLDDEIPETPQPIQSIRRVYSSDKEPELQILHEDPTAKPTPPIQPTLPTPTNSSQAMNQRNRRSTRASTASTTIDEENNASDDDVVEVPAAAKPATPARSSQATSQRKTRFTRANTAFTTLEEDNESFDDVIQVTSPAKPTTPARSSQLAPKAGRQLISSKAPEAHPPSINAITPKKPVGVSPSVSLAGFTSPRRLRSMKKPFIAPTRSVTEIPQFSSPARQPDTPGRTPLFWSLKGIEQPAGLQENNVPSSPVTPVAKLAKTRRRDEEDEASVLPPAKERKIDDVEDTYIVDEGGAETPKGRGMFTTALQEHAARQQKSSPALKKMPDNRKESPSLFGDDDFPWAEIEALEAAQLKKKAAHDQQAQHTSQSSASPSVPAPIEQDRDRTPNQSRFKRGESSDMFDDDLPWDEIQTRESSPIPRTSPIMSELPQVPFASQATAALVDLFPSDSQVMSEIDSMPPIHRGQNKRESSHQVFQPSSQHATQTHHTHPESSQPAIPVSSQMADCVVVQQESTDLSFLEDYISSDVEREMVEEEYEGCFDDADTITRELEQQGPIITGR